MLLSAINEELDKYLNQFAGFCFPSTATVNIHGTKNRNAKKNFLSLFISHPM
jgi:hypothetical protein